MAGTTPRQPGGTPWPARQFRPSRARRVGNAVIGVFVRMGGKDAQVEEFIAEADRHPVFELTPVRQGSP